MSHQRMVYVVDRDLETRRAFTAHLASIGAEAWPFASGGEFLEIFGHLMPACILLDMDLPHRRGLEVLAELRRRDVHWPVIATSAGGELPLAVEAMKLGAMDFLQKPIGEVGLEAALAPAWSALDRALETGESRRVAQERMARLTPRELDIAYALLSGQPNKGVAHVLGISVRTVEMHRAHIMAKLGVKSLAEAAVIATQAGLDIVPAGLLPTRDAPQPSLRSAPFAERRFASRGAF